MEYGKYLFNNDWFFMKLPIGSSLLDAEKSKKEFIKIALPHDWLIYQVENLYENSVGWYKKPFSYVKKDDERVELRFDGIYMDSIIYINGVEVWQWKYGYSAFDIDITSFLIEGQNEITVRVNYQAPNSRWYSGAGIYRDVWMKVTHKAYIPWDGIYVNAEKKEKNIWSLNIETELKTDRPVRLEYMLADKKARTNFRILGESYAWPNKELQKIQFESIVKEPDIWDVTNPVCYELIVRLFEEAEAYELQEERLTYGFRTFSFEPDNGFLLNGRKLKIYGVCEHHDLGCLGSAYHSDAMRRKLGKLKDMGANGIRFAHNMSAENAVELADEMGFVVISEAFDMWERSKTEFDYARFFEDWYKKDIASWIRRDRNHPSIIMWSIGNEIYDTQASERGQEITRMLADEVRKHDPKKLAPITICSNYMGGENAQRCADILKLTGYNYSERLYRQHHEAYPDWIIFGSETASTVQSRGIYHFPYRQTCLADEDQQCSSLGNSVTSWGAKSTEACIIAERDCQFSCGQFIWTGFDYIGEPTPYHTKNSYFGQIDTAGFPKDSFYLYQSEWKKKDKNPMVHLFPYWDFNEGQLIDVRACTNAAAVELFVNDRSYGIVPIDHLHGTQLCGYWQVPYEKGCIRAVAYDENGCFVAQDERHSFGEPVKIRLTSEKHKIQNGGRELNFVTVTVEDENGYSVENANNRIFAEADRNAVLIGLDNGDSTDIDEYKENTKCLFGGKLLIVMAAGDGMEEAVIKVSSPGFNEESIAIPVYSVPEEEKVNIDGIKAIKQKRDLGDEDNCEVPVRNIYLTSSYGTKLDKNHNETIVRAVVSPSNYTDRELLWSVVNEAGIPIEIAEVKAQGECASVKALSNGKFRLRCMSKAGTDHIRIISSLEFEISDCGEAYKNPYKFISAGLYDYVIGEIGNGNDHGIASSPNNESGVGFFGVDFGQEGTDEITLPIFGLNDEPYRIRIYEGMADQETAILLADVIYHKPKKWNVYQKETYKLDKKLVGVKDISFLFEKKLHLQGFLFTRINRAFREIRADECDLIYGDHYRKEKGKICEIGNNVTLEFRNMEFGKEGAEGIDIIGHTSNPDNLIQLRFTSEGQEILREIKFLYDEKKKVQSFRFERVTGEWDVKFVFLPGSKFDFSGFRFW